jgi:hypothetical protein
MAKKKTDPAILRRELTTVACMAPDHAAARKGSAELGAAIVYRAVHNIDGTAAVADIGAKLIQLPGDFGSGVISASVVDPSGNTIGIMDNPHYQKILATPKPVGAQ